MECAEKCILCRGTSNVEPVSFQLDEDSLSNMVALHLPFITIEITPEDQCCFECLTDLIQFRNFFNKIKLVQMKQEEIDDDVEIEAPKFEDSVDSQTVYLTGNASASLISEISPPKRLPTKPLVHFGRKYEESFITESVNMNCDVCNAELKSFEDALTHHRLIHKQEGYLICCDRKFNKRSNLIDHILFHRGKYKCSFCSKILSSQGNLNNHIENIHSTPTQFQCDLCSKYFVNEYRLVSHITRDHARVKVKNGRRGKVTRKGRPAIVQDPNQKFICEICGKESTTKYVLKDHIKHYHSDPKERTQCTICGHFLKNAKMLRKHQVRHKEDGMDFTCEFCGKKYTTRSSLVVHRRRSHLLPDKFPCSFCDKRFKVQIDLTEHEAVHRGIDLYKCQWCPASFKFKSSVSTHRKKAHPEHYDKGKPHYLKTNEELA